MAMNIDFACVVAQTLVQSLTDLKVEQAKKEIHAMCNRARRSIGQLARYAIERKGCS